MAWYDTGTVSVTNGSATVTGSGTNFIAGAQIGEAFYGPDDRLYEIQAIVSATSLTLSDPYLGSNQTGQSYYIIPTQSLVASLASQVSTLISDFQSVADEAGEGKFNNGTAALPGITFNLDQDTGFSRPAANQIGFSTAGVQRALLSSTALTVNVPLVATTADINGGTIDGTVIGGSTPAAISGTTGQFGTSLNVDGTVTANGLTVDGVGVFSSASPNIRLDETDTTDLNTRFRAQGGVLKIETVADAAGLVGTRMEVDHATGDISFYEDTGNTPKMVWKASDERLGIGTTTPNAPITIGDTTDAAGTLATFRADGVTNLFKLGSNDSKRFTIQGGSSTSSFSIERGTTEDFVIDSTGSVGIGTNNPAAKLDVSADALIHGATVGRGAGGISTNTAVGSGALSSNTTGINNTANGFQALRSNTTGTSNTANGFNALRSNTTGTSNTANGRLALFDNTEGSNNIGIGLNAGRSTSPRTITTASNEICIGNNDHTGAFIKIAFTVTSDARDKAELAPIPHGLDFVNALQPTEYQFKAGGRDGEADGIRRYGFLAQDVLAAEGDTPVIVNNDDPDSLKMTHDYLIPVLVNAVKELTAQVNDLMAEVAALKGQ